MPESAASALREQFEAASFIENLEELDAREERLNETILSWKQTLTPSQQVLQARQPPHTHLASQVRDRGKQDCVDSVGCDEPRKRGMIDKQKHLHVPQKCARFTIEIRFCIACNLASDPSTYALKTPKVYCLFLAVATSKGTSKCTLRA